MKHTYPILLLCLLFSAVLMLSLTTVLAGPPAKAEVCTNGRDDDKDGATDCEDSDCAADPACSGGGTFSAYYSTFNSLQDDKIFSDGLTCADYDYCDGVDKVMIGSDEIGFRFDTYTAKGKKEVRFVDMDLSGFGLSSLPVGLAAVDMRIQRNPGGLDLHGLCYGSGCISDCYMGAEGGFADPAEACLAGETSSLGKVGYSVTFVDNDGVQKSVVYGVRREGVTFCTTENQSGAYSKPLLVERTGKCTWNFTGETGCLCIGCGGGDAVIEVGGTFVPFHYTITEMDCTP